MKKIFKESETAGLFRYKNASRRINLDLYHGEAIVIEDGPFPSVVSSHRTIKAAKKEADRRQKLAGRDARFVAFEFEKKLSGQNPCGSGAKPKAAKKKAASRAGLAKPGKR